MKILLLLLAASAGMAQQRELPADKQELVSRGMLTAQAAQIALLKAQLESVRAQLAEILAADKNKNAEVRFEQFQRNLLKSIGAEECAITYEKKILCPEKAGNK